MMELPFKIGTLHFVGIGGIGMSGIAEILHNLGYKVQGSDLKDSANVQRLRDLGMEISIGHHGQNLGDAQYVVISSAVKADNPEYKEARKRRIPIVRRAEMLAELMRLRLSIAVGGTHGKTTTTSLIATILEYAQMDPTIVNGGILNALGTNARLGQGEWLVAEADESDGTFLRLPATIAVVTNIDPEHLDHYGNFDSLRNAFDNFVNNIPFYGYAALCIDHHEVQSMIARNPDRRIISYGFSPQADIQARHPYNSPNGVTFDVCVRKNGTETMYEGFRLPMPGMHNIQNACAAIAVCKNLDIDMDIIRQALSQFNGVKRRFTKTGEVNNITIIDDYAHHPVEIGSVLGAARDALRDENGDRTGKVIAVMQPHRYSRLKDLFEDFCTCFNDADHVIVANVFEAGESPIEGYNADSLAEGLIAHGHRSVSRLRDENELPKKILELGDKGDLVICLGAGSISAWANALPKQLSALLEGEK
ncbi:MAG: UDP-N-acetylmuramate--L-alanine ligase [Alphaproteobacteria bacterium]